MKKLIFNQLVNWFVQYKLCTRACAVNSYVIEVNLTTTGHIFPSTFF